MYRPSWENRTSEIEEIISEKKDRVAGSSSCSNSVEVSTRRAALSRCVAYASRADHKVHFLSCLRV
jgi:hypothetical protein